ncbi:MAG TPA: hypothetical protein GXX37_15485 [Clostridiaceae bacterium]|nr:hypothetical protein [Clostridiaceae bacterium]
MNTDRIDQDKIPKKTLSSRETIPSIELGTFRVLPLGFSFPVRTGLYTERCCGYGIACRC